MLATLWHDALVSGYHHEHEVYASRSGKHVPDEPLVARDVHYSDCQAVGIDKVGKTQVDGDAALLFLLEPVGIYSCKGLNKGAFSVVDVPSGAHYHVAHGLDYTFFALGIKNICCG